MSENLHLTAVFRMNVLHVLSWNLDGSQAQCSIKNSKKENFYRFISHNENIGGTAESERNISNCIFFNVDLKIKVSF